MNLIDFFNHFENNKHLINKDNVNEPCIDGTKYTPLHTACMFGKFHIVKYLISIGANPNLKDKYGRTPLYIVTIDYYYPEIKDYLQLAQRFKQ